MTSWSLWRLSAARCGTKTASTAPCLRQQPSQRLAHIFQSNTTYRQYGLYSHSRSSIWSIELTTRTSRCPNLPMTPVRLFTRRSRSSTRVPLPPRRRRFLQLAALALTLHIAYQLYSLTSSSDMSAVSRANLNKSLFTPCTVLSNETISPSAFLLTIQLPSGSGPNNNNNNKDIIAAAHAHGLWSVEVKQPQIQIARNYTPLPPPSPRPLAHSSPDADQQQQQQRPRQLQFYVRRYAGGEVSSYLSRLAPGDEIEIRGPHLGFDLAQRLGTTTTTTTTAPAEQKTATGSSSRRRRKVVFLAGGTGVAPAMQAAAAALRLDDDVDVDVLWASRAAADCAGCTRVAAVGVWGVKGRWLSWSWPAAAAVEKQEEEPSAVVTQFRALQDAYAARGRTLDVRCAVDAEGRFIGPRDIEDAVVRRGFATSPSSASCHFHSQRLLESCTEESDAADAKTGLARPAGTPSPVEERKKCTCVGNGHRGKNLFIVSGPDGFVSAYAGPKIWADGGERQGPVGGVVAELRRKDPEHWKNWLVLKQ